MKKIIIKSIILILIICLTVCSFSSCSKSNTSNASSVTSNNVQNNVETEVKGYFLGVKDLKNATRDIIFSSENPVYQFNINGETKDFCVDCTDESYPIQNRLMMGYEYWLKISGNKILSARIVNESDIKGIVSGYTPGERTLKNFLKTAVAPLGKTLYVYGGGWNVQDDGSSYISRTIGLSPTWKKFYDSNDANYSYENDTYPVNEWNTYYYAGLDCSGYLGWVLYNTIYKESEKEEGFICSSTKMAKPLAEKYNFGTFEHPAQKDYQSILNKLHPGDIVSMVGHIYIVIGVCDDGSVIILHSTVSKSVTGTEGGGVEFSALSKNGDNDTSCKAYGLIKEYTEKYFPEWAKRYPPIVKPISLFFDFPDDKETTGIFTWSNDANGLTDFENIKNMSAEDVLKTILE